MERGGFLRRPRPQMHLLATIADFFGVVLPSYHEWIRIRRPLLCQYEFLSALSPAFPLRPACAYLKSRRRGYAEIPLFRRHAPLCKEPFRREQFRAPSRGRQEKR